MHLPECDMIITWSEFIPKGYDYHDEYIVKKTKDDPAVILYSGGSTGKPKGILLSNLNFNALAMQYRASNSKTSSLSTSAINSPVARERALLLAREICPFSLR